MAVLDPRVVRVGIEIGGQQRVYDGLAITASGTKYAGPNQNDCQIQIANLSREVRDTILTETSPFNKNRTPKRVFLYAGRESYGAPLLYVGDITVSSVSQPPDILLTLKALTADYSKGDVLSRSQGAQTPLSTLARQVAADLGMGLQFEAQDKQVSNYAFTGGALKQVDKLGEAGTVNAYVDDQTLIVKDYNAALTGPVRALDIDSGLIGQPEFTEEGIKCTFLLDNQTRLGAGLRVRSVLNPAANGLYVIYKLGFNVASRDTPFYWIAEAKRSDG